MWRRGIFLRVDICVVEVHGILNVVTHHIKNTDSSCDLLKAQWIMWEYKKKTTGERNNILCNIKFFVCLLNEWK